MIEIFPFSLLQLVVAFFVHIYLLTHGAFSKIRTRLQYSHYKSSLPTTYFIIKSRSLSSDQMNFYLRDIRTHSELANVIIIGSHIDYDELYRNHYRVFGVIDTTHDKSLAFIRQKLYFYLNGLYKNV